MPVTINNKKYFRTAEACKEAGISRSTLLRWLKTDGLDIPDCRDRRSWRLFTEYDVRRLISEANRMSKG
jgi:DNA-binding transcriptional MerR regulator